LKLNLSIAVATGAILLATPALAHPHAETGTGVVAMVLRSGLDHVAFALVVGALGVGVAVAVRRRARARR
jgi:hypothetical protein